MEVPLVFDLQAGREKHIIMKRSDGSFNILLALKCRKYCVNGCEPAMLMTV
jgi:hypothetical protein